MSSPFAAAAMTCLPVRDVSGPLGKSRVVACSPRAWKCETGKDAITMQQCPRCRLWTGLSDQLGHARHLIDHGVALAAEPGGFLGRGRSYYESRTIFTLTQSGKRFFGALGTDTSLLE